MVKKTTISNGNDDREMMTEYRPDFLQVHYDIPVTNNGKRDRLREALKHEALEMLTQSVYGGPYSEEAVRAAKVIGARENVHINIYTPSFPADQRAKLIAQYESAFEQHFRDIDDELLFVEKAIMGEELYTDKKTGEKRPYNSRQLKQRLADVITDIEDLQARLVKRARREPSTSFEMLELRLRQSRSFRNELEKEVKHRIVPKERARNNKKLEDYSEK